ncbi:MAG TPA: hypothetical protein VEK08_18715 [Planctomycetota bacterium]|nr:hypothetical protein [Planctomycetota bacterium]
MKKAVSLMLLGLLLATGAGFAGEARKDDKDPLAKFPEDKLVDIGFCFQEFCKAVASKDARTAAAFIDDLPRGLKQLDLNKEADKASFLRFLAAYEGAQLVSSIRMAGGIGEVTYTKGGKELKQRMQNVGGRWKVTGL